MSAKRAHNRSALATRNRSTPAIEARLKNLNTSISLPGIIGGTQESQELTRWRVWQVDWRVLLVTGF